MVIINFFNNDKRTFRNFINITHNYSYKDLLNDIQTTFDKNERLSAEYYKRPIFKPNQFYIGKLTDEKCYFISDVFEVNNDDEYYIEYF